MIKTLKKYFKVYYRFLRFNLIYSMTYRASFLMELSIEILYTLTVLVFFNVVYGNIRQVAGWSYYEIMFLIGLDIIMSELFVATIFALNTNNVPEAIKNGTVDSILLKPINSQFSLTISRTYIPSIITMIPGFYLLYFALEHLHITLQPINVIMGVLILLCGFIITYSIMTIATSLAFYFTNAKLFPRIGMDMVMYFESRPHSIFNTVILKLLFFLLIPAVFVASIPTWTIIRGVEWHYVVMAVILACIFFKASTSIWNKMILYYSSATS
ncbi:MAG: ABC-2 family transporter protein [bacterium]|nr:ABC-2 family transporter protein [bacterium]